MTDDTGLKAMHCTIGTVEDLTESPEVVEILKLLVSCKASVSAADSTTQKRCPIHYCAMTGNYPATKFVLSVNKKVVNQSDGHGRTALHHACTHHSPNLKVVKLLLKQGATFGKKGRPTLKGIKAMEINAMLKDAKM